MWKRIQGYGQKERHAQIGNPVLLETTYDVDQLRRNPDVSDVQNANYRHNAPTQSYLAPHDPPNYRASEVPTVSSVYSRPSHDLAYYENPMPTSPSTYEDISPPSSPELNPSHPRRYKSMRDVSPIDENRGKAVNIRGSNIPVLRKAPPTIQTGETQPAQKFWGGKLAPDSKVKWDEYSGEPSNAGRAGSVSPGSYAKGVAPRQPMGYQVSVSGPEKKNVTFSERVGERVGRFGARSPPAETTKYEPWSRASGRSQIAPPLKDQPTAKPFQLPRKTLSPTANRLAASNTADASRPHFSGRTQDPVEADTGFVASSPHEDPIKPTPPLKVGKNSPSRGFASPVSPTHPTGLGIQALSQPVQKEQQQPIPQRAATPPQDPVANNTTEETPEKNRQASNSRFSWTTYNSSTTYQHSPPPSPPPALPIATPPRNRVVTEPITAASTASSILSRRRPVPQADRLQDPPLPIRNPITTDAPGTAKITSMASPNPYSPTSPSAASTFSTSTTKALPAPPTSLSAESHIAVLESQMEDLRIRRSNVYRLLNDLNNAAPPNPLITDFKRARLVEQRKRAFEGELSEIKREEHDVGLKLHRAWKKREREDPNQAGSAIWVRRVTS